MTEPKLPFAIDDTQSLIGPETADKGRSYYCPACGDLVILRKGEVKAPHFAHKVSESSEACSQQAIIYKTAKLLIQRAVSDWKSGKVPSPLVKRQCKICESVTEQPLPDKVDSARIEHKLAENVIADIALMVGDQAAAAIKIRVAGTVYEVKALSIPFIEIDGNEVLAHPTYWTPIVDKFKPLACQTCAANLKKFNAVVSKIATAARILLPTSYYRYSFCECWKCKKPTLVFTWPGKDQDAVPEREPRPKVVQYRFSKTVQDKYWGNACLHCNSLQGDWFLYSEPDGPFWGFEYGGDSPEDFQDDLKKLAYHANYIRAI